jgi:hypothetical protein
MEIEKEQKIIGVVSDGKIPISCRLRLCRMEPVYEGPGIAEWEHKGQILRMAGNFEVFECKRCGRKTQRMINFK